MKFIIKREFLLKPLQQVSSPLSGRHILPILGNLLIQVEDGVLFLTSTDLEIEIVTRIILSFPNDSGKTTVPARKFFEICRGLPENAKITVLLEEDRLIIRSGRIRFSLSTLSADDFPNLDKWKSKVDFVLPQIMIKRLIEATQFSMAFQDVRYYLNGLLFEIEENKLRAVATDGHRLAICSVSITVTTSSYSIIVPRKGVIELMRMINSNNTLLRIQIGSNNIRAHIGDCIFTSKLIDGCFPDYKRVLFKNRSKVLEINCDLFRKALSRVSIISNEKFRGVHLCISENQLKITANNPEKEEAEEILDIIYSGVTMEISLNANYVLDVLNALKCEKIRILLTDSISGIQIEDASSQNAIYVVMPIRL